MKEKILEVFYAAFNCFFRLVNYNKPRVFIYTDSRGMNVMSKNRKNPFNSYVGELVKRYNSTYFICREKHTTIIDFLTTAQKFNLDDFDFVILHCGVVDFSPRPLSNLNFVLQSKNENDFFKIAKAKYSDYYINPTDVLYKEEKTQSLYSPEFLEEIILPELKKINNLIWISSNHFVLGWEGNYTAGRPQNIDEYVSRFDTIMKKNLTNVVNLWTWSDENIKKYTIDNIHFTKEGFAEVLNLVNSKINREN